MTYEYHYEHGEANFGPPQATEIPNGAHLTLDIILRRGSTVYALRRPDGLHDGPKDALYFPHGLIRFGETLTEAADRLAREQAGVSVDSTGLLNLASWVDDEHWHMALNVYAAIKEIPEPSSTVSEVVAVEPGDSAADFAWWTQDQLDNMLKTLASRAGAGEL